MNWSDRLQQFVHPGIEELKNVLGPGPFEVTQCEGTERPFQNEFWNNKQEGIYVDIVSGEPLFCSTTKFDSGTGWPSFYQPISDCFITKTMDFHLGSPRVEVRSRYGNCHLGHVFDDGPEPTKMRYCINSAALRFISVSDMASSGYPDLLSIFENQKWPSYEIALLAAGCFWGVEEIVRKLKGVLATRVGYMGGNLKDPDYSQVKTGNTGHAETVEILFDQSKITYAEILRYFFKLHDPTTINRQGNDRGTQYRSAIFYTNESQRLIAKKTISEVESDGFWKDPIVTDVSDGGLFYPAEAYHQKYLIAHPDGYNCHFLRE